MTGNLVSPGIRDLDAFRRMLDHVGGSADDGPAEPRTARQGRRWTGYRCLVFEHPDGTTTRIVVPKDVTTQETRS